MKAYLFFVGAGAGLLVVVGLLLFAFQRRLLYPVARLGLPITLPTGVEKLDLSDGYSLFLNAAMHENDARPTLVFTHGNGETAFLWHDQFAEVLGAGISVLLVEYPGYGGASGKPSLGSITRTMLAAHATIVARSDVDRDAIIAYGRSIGGGAAAILARDRNVAALGLESTFSSMSELVADHGFPRFLLRDRYDNRRIVRDLDVPIFLFHGLHDGIIRFDHVRRLEAVARNAVTVTGGCGHNDCARPWAALLRFLHEKTKIEIRKRGS